MKKNIHSLLLLLALLLPATANAYDFEVDGIYYRINGTEATVTFKGNYSQNGNSYSGNVTIPATVTYEGMTYSVTSIGSSAFYGCSGLTSIDIPNSVTSIGYSAFYGCSGLTRVTIGNSVISIDYRAFGACSGLTSMTVASGNTKYDSRNGCNAIIETASNTLIVGCQNTIIPNSVTTIGHEAFSGCSGLTSIDIPNSVTSIGNAAFYNCSSLTSVSIGNSVTSIVSSAFYGCSGLTSMTVASGNTKYDSRNGCNAIIETASNTLIAGCKNTTIPNSVTSIGSRAFEGCSGLTSIDIPNSVTTIGYGAFGCSGLTSIDIPNSVTTIGYGAFNGCSGLTCVTIGNSVISIGDETFSDCSGLTSVTIGNSVTTIGKNAFYYCTGLTSVTIPNSVTSIGTAAFAGCSGLTSVTIGNSVTSIGEYAFQGCSSLTSIDIPNSVTSIGGDAFSCTPWYDNHPDGLVYAGLVAYKYKGTMPTGTSITLADGTLGIAGWAFDSCNGLTNIDIPNSVTSIGYGAFIFCRGLTSIDIPNSVTSIGGDAFYCTPWYDNQPDGLVYAGLVAYAYKGEMPMGTSITLADGTLGIAGNAFRSCSGLTSITIPNSVTNIGDEAFLFCSGLTEIYSFALTPPTVYEYTFIYSGASLFIPSEAVNAYKAADYWKNFANIIDITFEVDGISYRATTDCASSVIADEDEETLYSGDVVIPDAVTYNGRIFAVTGIEDNAFDNCYELTSVVIPNTVEAIGEQAFQGCTSLTSVIIGSGVTAIGTKAFNYCNSLETVKCLGTVPPVMASSDCFSTAAYNRATLRVPRNSEAAYAAADYWYRFSHLEGWGSAGIGDIDGDGHVNIKDVTALIDALLSGNTEDIYFESADMNYNGHLDIGDVTTLIDYLLNH